MVCHAVCCARCLASTHHRTQGHDACLHDHEFWDIFVWWDKPLNVGCPIQVFAMTTGGQGGDRGSGNVEPAILKAPNVRRQLYKLVQELQWRDVGNFIIREQDGNCDMFTPKVPTFWSRDLNEGQVIVAGSITLMVGIIF